MISTVERILFLNKIPLFEGFSVDELWQVAQSLEERKYEPGEVIFEEGKPAQALYLIVSGVAVISMAGKEILRVGEEAVIGDVAVLDGLPHVSTLSAESEILAIRIDREKLDDILAANPSAARGVIRILCRKLRLITGQGLESFSLDEKGELPVWKP